MLMLTIHSMMSMLLITGMKLKTLWEMMIIMLTIMNLLFMSMNYMSEVPMTLSMNYTLDSMSIILLSLSMWISSLMMMASYKLNNKKMNPKLFMFINLLLLIILMVSFSINNTIMFYIMFESSMIPIFLLIILWGNQPERKKASFYIIMYTILASMPFLIIILKLLNMNYHNMMSYNLPSMSLYSMMMNNNLSWMMLMMAFMVKLPIFSLHLWLPKAHVEAPVAGSMILAAILLKLGGYGHIRMNKMINQPMFKMSYIIMSIATIGAIITNILCLRQTDLKGLIAYSSVSHMGLMIMSTLSNSKLGQFGSMLMMLTHGLTSSCMFLLANMMYQKTNSRNIMFMGGLLNHDPILSMMWTLTISSNMAIPPSLNIISEIIITMSSMFISKTMITLLMTSNLTTAMYSMYLYSMINYNNQLKSMNSSMQIKSSDMIIIISHLWPLLIMSLLPMKLMMWC